MNSHANRYPSFWEMLDTVHDEGGRGHAHKVLADWLDEHDDPVRAHVFRHGVPHTEGHVPEQWRDAGQPAHWVQFENDEPRFLRGNPEALGDHDSPVAAHFDSAGRYQLFRAMDPRGFPSRWAVRYTIPTHRGPVALTAPMPSAHLHALADAWEKQWHAQNPNASQVPYNHFRDAAQNMEWHENHATHLARVRLGMPRHTTAFSGDRAFEYPIHDEAGAKIGHITVIPRGPMLHVDWVGATNGANSLGPEASRAIHDELAKEYPEAQYLTGKRVSGFRPGVGQTGERVVVPIRRRPTKLARWTDDRTTLHNAARVGQIRGDYHPLTVLADKMEEDGAPGAHLLRAYAAHRLSGVDHEPPFDAEAEGGSQFVNLDPDTSVQVLHYGRDIGNHLYVTHAPEGAAPFSVGSPHIDYTLPIPSLEHFGKLSADWPVEARHAVARILYSHGTPVRDRTKLARVQAGPGGAITDSIYARGGQFVAKARKRIRDVAAKLVKLARPKADPEAASRILKVLEKHGTVGGFYRFLKTAGIHPNFGGMGMSKAELRMIEKLAKLDPADRLSEHPSVKALKPHEPLGVAARKRDGFGLGDVFRLLNAVARGQLDKHKILSAMRDTRVSPEARAAMHAAVLADENGLFIGHMGDPVSAGGHWYTTAMNPLDVALHRIFAKGESDPNWGSVDWRHPGGPRLRHENKPVWETAPHQPLAKAVVGFLSGQRDPVDNTDVAVRLIEEAKERAAKAGHDNWVETIPLAQHAALDRWLKIPGVYQPGSTKWNELLRWARDPKIAPHNNQGTGQRGFRVTGVHAVRDPAAPAGWHVVGTAKVGGKDPRPSFFSPEDEKRYNEADPKDRAKFDGVPMVTPDGNLRPKAWSTLEAVSANIRDLQRIMLHALDQTGGDRKAAAAVAAKWLLTEHPVAHVEKILNDSRIDGPELRNRKGEARRRTVERGYIRGDHVPGSWIFGPKFGAFFQNIHGNTPVPPGENPDYFTRWLTADVHWTRGHNYRTGSQKTVGSKVADDQPKQSQRLPMFFAAQKAAEQSPGIHTPSATQAVDWFATKSLPGLFGHPVDLASFVHGANKVLSDRGHTGALMNDDGTLVHAPKNPPPRKAGLGQRAEGITDTTKLARRFGTDTGSFVGELAHERPQMTLSGQPFGSSHTHDVMADKMDEDGDPRADVVRSRIRESGVGGNIDWMGAMAHKARMNRGLGLTALQQAIRGQFTRRTFAVNYVRVPHPDGGHTEVHRVRLGADGLSGPSVYHITSALPLPGGTHEYHAAMDHEEFNRWRDSMDPDERDKFLFTDERTPDAPAHPDTIDHNAPMKSTHLARAADTLTWVGGRVPGGVPAQGFWPGGAEESSVVSVPAAHADRAPLELAKRLGQKSALWFTPGAGRDALHVIRFDGGVPRSLDRVLQRHGVSEFTITKSPVTVHVVDPGDTLGDAVKAAAADAGGKYARFGGTASFAELK